MPQATTAQKLAPEETPAGPAELWTAMELQRRLEAMPAEARFCDSQRLITFYTELLSGGHGDALAPRSDGLGQGTVLTVKLPGDDEPGGAGERPEGVGAVPAPPLRVLVVDDNRDSADSLGMLFRLVGHDVRTAHDGLEAIAAADEFRPDAILLDIGLPKLDGYEVARQIRRLDWGRKTTLIAVTGWGQAEDRERSQQAGFDHHLIKPVDPSALLELLTGKDCPKD